MLICILVVSIIQRVSIFVPYINKNETARPTLQFFVVNKHRWPNKQGMIFAKLNSCQPAVQITRFYTHVCMHIFQFFSSVFLDFSFKFAAPPEPAVYDIKLSSVAKQFGKSRRSLEKLA
jgi:hypothetical protein